MIGVISGHCSDPAQSYYQWVFFLLLGQALLLAVPKFLWNAFNWKTGESERDWADQGGPITLW